jgi:hypothetical protein
MLVFFIFVLLASVALHLHIESIEFSGVMSGLEGAVKRRLNKGVFSIIFISNLLWTMFKIFKDYKKEMS